MFSISNGAFAYFFFKLKKPVYDFDHHNSTNTLFQLEG